jgi:hypothetical protein
MYDAGRVLRPIAAARDDWMHVVGTGLQFGDSLRLEVFWPLEAGRSAQFLVRLRPTF